MADTIINWVITILTLPIQMIIYPVDLLIASFDPNGNLSIIPESISAISDYLKNIPNLIVKLSGLSPVIWNFFIAIGLGFLTLNPLISLIKKVWGFIRP